MSQQSSELITVSFFEIKSSVQKSRVLKSIERKKKKMIKPKFFKRETRRRRRKDRMIKSRIKSRAQVRPEFEARSEFASAFNEAVLYRRWQHRGEVENPKVARAR